MRGVLVLLAFVMIALIAINSTMAQVCVTPGCQAYCFVPPVVTTPCPVVVAPPGSTVIVHRPFPILRVLTAPWRPRVYVLPPAAPAPRK
jgi:hypothetical protein